MSLLSTVQWLLQKLGKCANPSWPCGSHPHWYDSLIIRLPANHSSLTICYVKLLSSTPASVQLGCADWIPEQISPASQPWFLLSCLVLCFSHLQAAELLRVKCFRGDSPSLPFFPSPEGEVGLVRQSLSAVKQQLCKAGPCLMWGTATGDADWRSCITRIVSPWGTGGFFLWEPWGATWRRGEGWWTSFCNMSKVKKQEGLWVAGHRKTWKSVWVLVFENRW